MATRIDWVNDYGVPILVGGIELGLKAWDESRKKTNPAAMEYEPLAPYTIAGLGTVLRVTGMLPHWDTSVKMAVAASMPRVITGIYDWVTKPAGTTGFIPRGAMAMRQSAVRVERVPSGSPVAGQVAARQPEFEEVRIV